MYVLNYIVMFKKILLMLLFVFIRNDNIILDGKFIIVKMWEKNIYKLYM